MHEINKIVQKTTECENGNCKFNETMQQNYLPSNGESLNWNSLCSLSLPIIHSLTTVFFSGPVQHNKLNFIFIV